MSQGFGLQPGQILHSAFIALSNMSPLSMILTIFGGLIAGFLINYLADVLPQTRRLSQPRCPECETPYSTKDYFLLRKCPNCGRKRNLRTYLVLVGSIIVSILLQFFPFAGLSYWATLPLMIFLGILLVIDMEHRLVLAETSLLGIIVCVTYGLVLRNPTKTFLGGLNGFLIMLFFYILGIIFSFIIGKIRGRNLTEVAFGFGDVTTGTFLGLLTGWPGIVGVVILALVIFAAFSILVLLGLIVSRRYRAFANAQPFVPFLILGSIIMFYL